MIKVMVENVSLITERKLIEQCLHNDRSAQKAIYERLAPRMYPICLRYVGDRGRAKDALHDGFITLFSKIATYKGNGSFEGWARKIFVNTALMQIRKSDALKYSEDIESPSIDLPFEQNIAEQMDSATLMNVVAQMPLGFRTVFNLYVIEGYTHSEIAKELDITEGGSRSQLSRAKEWLKIRLRDFTK